MSVFDATLQSDHLLKLHLQTTDEHVKRILINQRRIESQVLTYRRREAQDILQRIGGGSAWSLDKMSIQVYS